MPFSDLFYFPFYFFAFSLLFYCFPSSLQLLYFPITIYTLFSDVSWTIAGTSALYATFTYFTSDLVWLLSSATSFFY